MNNSAPFYTYGSLANYYDKIGFKHMIMSELHEALDSINKYLEHPEYQSQRPVGSEIEAMYIRDNISDAIILLNRKAAQPQKPEDPVKFSDLRIETRYNIILRHNRSLLATLDKADEKIKQLTSSNEELKRTVAGLRMQPSLAAKLQKQPPPRPETILVETPDVIGETIQLKKKIASLENQLEALNHNLKKSIEEKRSLARALKFRR